ncbi:MAG: GNAT family N-acetyltransferase [Chloroflexi bacterium]|nr:GNAT family N-acetyltransferase [Chloroflexota bacterium]
MVKISRYTDPAAYLARAESFWLRNEAANCLSIGLTNSLIQNVTQFGQQQPYLAILTDDAGEIVLTALRTPPRGLILSVADWPVALDALIEDPQSMYESLPTVLGEVELARQFAECWSARKGVTTRMQMPERIYQVHTVKVPTGVPGFMRRITPEDRSLLIDWMVAFEIEAFGAQETPRENFNNWVDGGLSFAHRGIYLWEDPANGGVVSMVGHTGPTPHGMRVGPVYTPPEKRGHGYASACTAGVTQTLLDSGRTFCFLYTNLNNPTSNKIYQQIGYEPVIDCAMYSFDAS